MNEPTEISILGSKWTIHILSKSEDPILEGVNGYCDWTARKIVACSPRNDDGVYTLSASKAFTRQVLRREIVHAFLMECGLNENSNSSDAWACNEEMIDWFAIMGDRIYSAWYEAEAAI